MTEDDIADLLLCPDHFFGFMSVFGEVDERMRKEITLCACILGRPVTKLEVKRLYILILVGQVGKMKEVLDEKLIRSETMNLVNTNRGHLKKKIINRLLSYNTVVRWDSLQKFLSGHFE